MKNTDRIKYLDIARALCALYVVGYWHLACYLPDSSSVYTPIGQCITEIFMGCFFFISGFLHRKYTFKTRNDLLIFYRRKFERFYILFIVATLSLYIANQFIGAPMFTGSLQLLLTLMGLTTLYPPHAGMLWFMSMIMLFYILTPALSMKRYRYSNFITLILFFWIWMKLTGHLDKMVFVYLSVYFLGIISTTNIIKKLQQNPIAALCGSIAVVYGSLYIYLGQWNIICSIISCIGGSLCILTVSNLLSKLNIVYSIMNIVAYSSLCAYLFHRHYYSIINSTLEHFGIESNVLILISLYIPVCILLSWLIQMVYDSFLSLLNDKKSTKQLA